MLRVDKTALICDFAETYHILDFESLPVFTAAALAVGLRDNSRIRLKMTGQKVGLVEILLATLIDRFTSFASGGEIDQSILKLLTSEETDERDSRVESFDTAEDFERRRNEILRRA